jgi:predicted anti-sigma-YlaC factor YlaD
MAHAGDCRHLLNSLSEYIDQELEDQVCQILEAHLAECENCRIVVDTLRKTVYLYKATASDPEMPQEVRERLYRSLDLGEFLNTG